MANTFFIVDGRKYMGELDNCESCGGRCGVNITPVRAALNVKWVKFETVPAETVFKFDDDTGDEAYACSNCS